MIRSVLCPSFYNSSSRHENIFFPSDIIIFEGQVIWYQSRALSIGSILNYFLLDIIFCPYLRQWKHFFNGVRQDLCLEKKLLHIFLAKFPGKLKNL